MGAIPDWVYVHTVLVEPFLGRSGAGPLYGDPAPLRCLITDKRQLVRGADGRQVVAAHSLHFPPGTDVPVESRVTVRGRPTTALTVQIRDGGGLPTPDHVLVMCE